MKLTLSDAPYAGAPVVVLSAGLGGAGSYWLAQLATLEAHYQVVRYDQRGTGNNPATLPDGYSMQAMAAELYQALQAEGINRFCLIGHALGALIGLQLALDYPQAVSGLVLVNGWLRLNDHTLRCFRVRERLLAAGGAEAWVQAQPLFLYPADWMAAHAPRMEAEEALALAHFQGTENLLRRLAALKNADFSRRAQEIRCPTNIICARDDLLVPWTCSADLQAAIPGSRLQVMERGAHACNVTESEDFNTLLLDGLHSMLPVLTLAQKENL
ncbi:pyrimidine utilization protein D [Kosakonia oryzae]|uniref:pyrimidine utilization protein D n=1 Tax=Kosakonia oryzae TaxID=497725 RepID=UPI001D0835CA|nr:pyrimidine utilization protein D [Kosakonia oryzae]UDJ80671.1 pyrimidine utilization protein D [Kosakonia oryzae]